MPQSAHIFHSLHPHVFGKNIIFRVNAAGEDKVLPDQDAIPVAQIVEALFLVEPATPHAQHIHMGFRCIRDQTFHLGVTDAGRQGISRDPVRTFDEQLHPVDHESEGFAPLVRFTPQLDRAQPHLVTALVQDGFPGFQAYSQAVERLVSKFIRPP